LGEIINKKELSSITEKIKTFLASGLMGYLTWEIFRRYKPTPLKMNLILEIRLVPEQVGKLFPQRILSFPHGFFYSVSAPLDSAHPYF
jgi:hypothetical protein